MLFFEVGWHFGAVRHLVSNLPAVMASDDDLFGEARVLLGRRGDLEPRVGVLALRPLGAEAGQVVEAEDPADVPVAAVGTVPAETTVVPGAVADLALRVDVKERALLVVTGICKTTGRTSRV